MDRAIVVRGNLSDPKHIVLAEPVTELTGEVEVVVRRIPPVNDREAGDVFDLIARLRAGVRSKEDIDRQVSEERGSWGER